MQLTMYYIYCCIDLEVPLEDRDLRKCAYEIVDIWFQVGLALDLDSCKLKAIEVDYPNRNEKAAIEMLIQWKQAKNNPPRRVLHEAVKDCQTQARRGMYLMSCNCTHQY